MSSQTLIGSSGVIDCTTGSKASLEAMLYRSKLISVVMVLLSELLRNNSTFAAIFWANTGR